MSVPVIVALYSPYDEKDPRHWSIYLEVAPPGPTVMLEVLDDNGPKGYHVGEPRLDTPPERTSKHYKSVNVGSIASGNFDMAVAAMKDTPCDNESKTWNCQAWVVEALDGLAEAGLFEWEEGKRDEILELREDWQ